MTTEGTQHTSATVAATNDGAAPAGGWTVEAVRALGVCTNLPTAASILTISATKAYEMARNDEFPVPIIKTGTRYVVPTARLLAILGATDSPAAGTTPAQKTPQNSLPDTAFRELAQTHARTLRMLYSQIEDLWRQRGDLPPEADGLWTAIGRFVAVYGKG